VPDFVLWTAFEMFRKLASPTSAIYHLFRLLPSQDFEAHQGEVRSVRFNPSNNSLLLSGSYDGSALVTDIHAALLAGKYDEAIISCTCFTSDDICHHFAGGNKKVLRNKKVLPITSINCDAVFACGETFAPSLGTFCRCCVCAFRFALEQTSGDCHRLDQSSTCVAFSRT